MRDNDVAFIIQEPIVIALQSVQAALHHHHLVVERADVDETLAEENCVLEPVVMAEEEEWYARQVTSCFGELVVGNQKKWYEPGPRSR